jgi:hypothetical protein
MAFYYVVAGWAGVITTFVRLEADEGVGQVVFYVILFGGTLGGVVWIGLLVQGVFAGARAAIRGELLGAFPAGRAAKWAIILGGTSAAVGLGCAVLILLSGLLGC